MNTSELLRLLTSGETVSLAAWYGEPLPPREADFWREAIRERLYSRGTRLQGGFSGRLAEMIVHYWADQPAGMDYENLLATAASEEECARLELCYGELLLARKLQPAWRHLDAGFAAAAHLFRPDEYFVVLKRHESLRHLVLSPTAADGAGLDALLKEAAVIHQLRGERPAPTGAAPKHGDTVD